MSGAAFLFLKINPTEIFMQVSGSRSMCILKFKDIPKRLYQHTSPQQGRVMRGEMGSPSGTFLLMNNCSELMHIATMLSFVISLKGNQVGGKPGKVSITKNRNQNFLSLSLDLGQHVTKMQNKSKGSWCFCIFVFNFLQNGEETILL